MKAMIMALRMVATDCRNVPRRSEMPSCRVLDVEVIAVAGAPGGMESMTWIGCEKSACK